MSDGSIVIDVLLDDGQVVKGVANIDKQLGGLQQSGEKGALGIGKIVTALGLVAIAGKGIGMIKEGIQGAFARIDTMESFTRVMTVMTGSTEKAIQALENARLVVKGTAYGLDVAAKGVQDFVTRGVGIDKATERLKAWGDAVAFYGDGSNAQLANVMDALAKMTTSGKVGMDQMNRLFDAGIDAVGMYAKATGRDANAVQKDLSKGKISAEEFIDTVTKAMMEGTNGVQNIAGAAKEAGASWTGTFDNMQAAVNRGVVNIIQAIDEMLTANGLPNMRTMVAHFGSKFEETLNKVATAIPSLVDKLKEVYKSIEPWMPLILNVATVVGAFLVTMGTLNSVIGITRNVIGALNVVLMANPFVLIAAAIVALIVVLAQLYKSNEEFRNKVNEIWTSVQERFSGAFKVIKDVATTVMKEVVSFLSEQLDKLKAFWDENGTQILAAVQNVFNGILAVIKFIMPAVLFVVDMIWTAIKQVISGALDIIMGLVKVFTGIFTGDFKKVWEGVKQIFFGAIDLIMGWMTLSFFGGIRAILTNLLKSSTGIIKNMWTSIVNFFKNFSTNVSNVVKNMATGIVNYFKGAVTNSIEVFNALRTFGYSLWNAIYQIFLNAVVGIFNIVKNTFTKMLTSIKDIFGTVRGTISKIWDDVMKFFKGISLEEVGKNIIQGLIKGIGAMAGAVVDSVKGIGNSIKNSFTSLLGIKSPSRVFMEYGKNTGEGLAIGIESTKKANKEAVEGVAKVLSAVARDNANEIKKISVNAEKERAAILQESTKKRREIESNSVAAIQKVISAAATKKKKNTAADSAKIHSIREDAAKKLQKLEEDNAKKIASINSKAAADIAKKESELARERLDTLKNYISDKKSLDELSLVAEAEVWRKSLALFKDGTKEKIEVQKGYQSALRAINDEIESINKEHSDKVQRIIDDSTRAIQEQNDAYNKAFSDRVGAITSFAGIFDEFVVKMENSGQDLLRNLQSQVIGLAEWRAQLDSLWGRIDDQALMEELEAMGPKALGELRALNSLSDAELQQYVALYNAKFTLAREQATHELAGLKTDTEHRITELREAANAELDKVHKEWVAKIVRIAKTTDNELKSLKDIGKNAGQGLLNGLASMEGALVAKAKSIAESVKAAMASALQIHSPSRWMRDMIGKNMMLGWMKGIDGQKSKTLKKAREATDWMKPDIPTVGGFVNKLRGVKAPLGNVMPFSAATGSGDTITNTNSRSYNPTFQNYFTKDESTPSEVARKNKQQSQRQAMEWGMI